jgi:hypothetical protein
MSIDKCELENIFYCDVSKIPHFFGKASNVCVTHTIYFFVLCHVTDSSEPVIPRHVEYGCANIRVLTFKFRHNALCFIWGFELRPEL